MDELGKELRRIQNRMNWRRKRDTFGRFDVEDGRAKRCEGLYVRLTAAERDMIRHTAVEAGQTVTETLLQAVRLYATTLP